MVGEIRDRERGQGMHHGLDKGQIIKLCFKPLVLGGDVGIQILARGGYGL